MRKEKIFWGLFFIFDAVSLFLEEWADMREVSVFSLSDYIFCSQLTKA